MAYDAGLYFAILNRAMFPVRFLLLSLALCSGLANAQNIPVDCGLSRDPARCEVNQAALAACSHERGKRKTACLAEHLPPVDCSKASNPTRCEATERAKQTCADKSGKAQKACLKGEKQAIKKAKKAGKKKASKKKSRT